MRILITGADLPLGAAVARALCSEHELRLTGTEPLAPAGTEGCPYTPADLREPDQVAPLVSGMDAIAHLAPHAAPVTPNAAAEKDALDHSGRGIYVLLHAALKAGVGRVVMASRLELMAAYPENYIVDPNWRPKPAPDAASLAPFVAELTLREFVRAEEIVGVCLRLGDLGSGPADTTEADAITAVTRALTMDLEGRKYRWWLYHIASTDRFPLANAAQPPLSFVRTGA